MKMATLTRPVDDQLSFSCLPLGENEASIVDDGHLLKGIDASVFIGPVLELSQCDGLRLERNASHSKEDVQRT